MLNKSQRQASLILVSLMAIGFSMPMAQAEDPIPSVTCAYDPDSGLANPLGMRSYIRLQEVSGNTNVIFDQFPSNVAGPRAATIAFQRVLTFYDLGVSDARQLLLSNPTYYNELVGYDAPDGFGPVNNVLACRVADAATTGELSTGELPTLEAVPTPQPPPANTSTPITPYDTIASLPDGNYRYWSGQSEFRVVGNQELLDRGGALFVFHKTGNAVTGAFSYVDNEAICVSGRVSGNTISGQAYPYSSEVRDLAESFEPWGPAGFLQVRRAQTVETGDFYDSAILNLNDFSRINAGAVLPPERCAPAM
ncbi:MAG: hypothetical protein AAGF01_11975 [Cyanobacteria bacterium P01_G01_bin.38]